MSTALQCPVCEQSLEGIRESRLFRCASNHTFDIAKEGYINLLMSYEKKSDQPGDSKEMVSARTAFLEKNYYKPISMALNQRILELLKLDDSKNTPYHILDLGCGEGYYTQLLAQTLGGANTSAQIYGLDISKMAVRVAAKRLREGLFVVANSYFAPFHPNSLDVILSVFSPLSLTECMRMLKPGGHFVRVFPQVGHLMELKEIIYPEIKVKEYEQYKVGEGNLVCTETRDLSFVIDLVKEDLERLLSMTPHFWRVKQENKARLMALDAISVTVAVTIATFIKVEEASPCLD